MDSSGPPSRNHIGLRTTAVSLDVLAFSVLIGPGKAASDKTTSPRKIALHGCLFKAEQQHQLAHTDRQLDPIPKLGNLHLPHFQPAFSASLKVIHGRQQKGRQTPVHLSSPSSPLNSSPSYCP
ncbi:uncharacterized protein CLUP02_11381 [Colletotrichum lupini]|uniref:Uncharacterized protein n=1 Tax=Colletotrichum lupini TaxID=145971 RepID=A0A9Q8WK86_9PEZI|nr:uncharacterized protein CLUP02_11381 [Colletotrichum lupini]UQC85882.1 hypothetical protein CLUP02_11381 [Colletotrichum lupini]